MKRSLVALAVLAVSGASMAQVTLYGVVDLAYGQTNDPKINNTNLSMKGNTIFNESTSRWGIKSVEDLGGGLKATVNFEQALNYTTGAASTANARMAYGALSGDFGEFRFGRTLTPSFYGAAAWELTGYANYSAAIDVFGIAGDANPRNDAQASYTTPIMGGFAATLGYVAEQDDALNIAAAAPPSSKFDANLIYAQGPLSVGLSYWKLDKVAVGASTDGNYSLGAKYNFGSFILAGSYQDPAGVSQGYTFGATIPVGAWSFTADVAQDTAYSQTNYLLYASYNLSKRTKVYFDYNRHGKTGDLTKPARAWTTTNTQDIDNYAVGFRHAF